MRVNKLYRVREGLGNQIPSEKEQSIIFDWDDNNHFAVIFNKGDSREAVAEKLMNAHRRLLAFDDNINKSKIV